MSRFAESTVEDAALAWLESLGWAAKHGPEIAPGGLAAERSDYPQAVLQNLQRDALLPKLSGKIRIKDVQQIAGEVA